MKIGYYPGSFHPWHEGHEDVLKKALLIFDRVYIAFGTNPEKTVAAPPAVLYTPEALEMKLRQQFGDRIIVRAFTGLLVDHVRTLHGTEWQPDAVVRGLRNGDDLQYEMTQQYWNEDLGLGIPVALFITDRRLAHISSSAIRAVAKLRAVAPTRS